MQKLRDTISIVVTTLLLSSIVAGVVSCKKRYVPKPYGYVRYYVPDTGYIRYNYCDRCSFDMSRNAVVVPREERYWMNLYYPQLNAVVHCSYKDVNADLRALSDEAQDFAYKHAGKASAISEQGYDNESADVHGVLYTLSGNTASPYQFYATDSTRHFFRGAVYFNCIPNQDSLQPAIDYINKDIIRLMESLRWSE